MTLTQLQNEYQARFGIQGAVIWDMTSADLIDGLTNPAHIPLRSRPRRQAIEVGDRVHDQYGETSTVVSIGARGIVTTSGRYHSANLRRVNA
jgi:translation initiation factor IF-1